MKKRWLCLWSFLCIAGLFGVMHLKSDVTTLARERLTLIQEQRQLREDLRVLKAEYAHLASPDRLWVLAQQRGFQELEVRQLARLYNMPTATQQVAWRP